MDEQGGAGRLAQGCLTGRPADCRPITYVRKYNTITCQRLYVRKDGLIATRCPFGCVVKMLKLGRHI